MSCCDLIISCKYSMSGKSNIVYLLVLILSLTTLMSGHIDFKYDFETFSK